MSNKDLAAYLAIPAESDDHFLCQLEYEDPLHKASIWLHKLIVHRIRDIQRLAPWYRGEVAEPTHDESTLGLTRHGQLISDLLNQDDGRFCDRFAYYCRMIKKYRQGELPRHIVDDDRRAAEIMISSLVGLAGDTETLRLLKRRVREFAQLVTANDGSRLIRADYLTKLDVLSDNIITIKLRQEDKLTF